jgi:hypothetical protein
MGFHQDPMMLVQDAQTQRCVIAFAGINNYGTLVAAHSIKTMKASIVDDAK